MSLVHIEKDLASVAAATFQQLIRYTGISAPKLRHILRKFKAQGLVTTSTEYIRARDVSGPIMVIGKGHHTPVPGAIAYQAALRWSEIFEPTMIIRATAKLCTMYGTEVKHIAMGSMSHEIGLTEVLLKKRQQQPDFEWKLVQPRPGTGPLADAISASGELMVEVIGRYGTDLVAAKISLSAIATLELW